MGVEVEIWGGPHDGKVYAVENIHYPLTMALPLDPVTAEWSEVLEPYAPALHIIELKIVLTSNGWKAIWPKGES